MAKCYSTGVMSLPAWMSSGDDTEAILGASNLNRLSCYSFHLIRRIYEKGSYKCNYKFNFESVC